MVRDPSHPVGVSVEADRLVSPHIELQRLVAIEVKQADDQSRLLEAREPSAVWKLQVAVSIPATDALLVSTY